MEMSPVSQQYSGFKANQPDKAYNLAVEGANSQMNILSIDAIKDDYRSSD